MKKTVIPKSIDVFLESLMLEHGDNILPGDIQGAIKYDLYQSLNDFLTLNIANGLSPEKLDEFNELILSNPGEVKVKKFLKENTDYKAAVKLSCSQLKEAYLENKKRAQK